jgi:hypothetical protein
MVCGLFSDHRPERRFAIGGLSLTNEPFSAKQWIG